MPPRLLSMMMFNNQIVQLLQLIGAFSGDLIATVSNNFPGQDSDLQNLLLPLAALPLWKSFRQAWKGLKIVCYVRGEWALGAFLRGFLWAAALPFSIKTQTKFQHPPTFPFSRQNLTKKRSALRIRRHSIYVVLESKTLKQFEFPYYVSYLNQKYIICMPNFCLTTFEGVVAKSEIRCCEGSQWVNQKQSTFFERLLSPEYCSHNIFYLFG